MRDPKRIFRIIKKLLIAWERFPDCRFGQLVEIIATERIKDTSLFNVEDGSFEESLDEFLVSMNH